MTESIQSVPLDLASSSRIEVGVTLQAWLADLVDLSLRLKQAHWNLRGPRFLSIHEQLDEILVDVRNAVDDVAERIVILGAPADGRARTVVDHSRLAECPGGFLDVDQAIALCVGDLGRVSERGREAIHRLGEIDPVSEDLAVGIVAALEKHAWMLDAQRAHES